MNVASERNATQTILPTTRQVSTGPFDSSEHVAVKEGWRPRVLIVSGDQENREALTAILSREGWDALCVSRVNECRGVLFSDDFALVFCDRRLPDGTYFEVLAMTQCLSRNLRVVVTSRNADWEQYLEALRYGAFELIVSPCKGSDVVWVLSQAKREDYKRAVFGLSKAGFALASSDSRHS